MKITFSVAFDNGKELGLCTQIAADCPPNLVARAVKALLRSLVWTLQIAGYLDDVVIDDVLRLGSKDHPAPRKFLEEERLRMGLEVLQRPLLVVEKGGLQVS